MTSRIRVRDARVWAVSVLTIVTLLCWAWIVPMASDMYGTMSGRSAWMMTSTWDARHVALLFAMWTVMMAGMMLPSAAPILLLYTTVVRKRGDAIGIYAMAAGYLTVWTVFSAGATLLQRLLANALILSPMMVAISSVTTGALLVLAGGYQLSPYKATCLNWCRSPLVFLSTRWRAGASGAFRMGVEHGLQCLGCCWALMLLLFAGGVMNLWVITALTIVVLVEKLAPRGELVARALGVLFIAAGLWVAGLP